ncbi:MAG TPA: hypothetical protein VHK68_11375, partial [Gemmatimonadales bacterium]|nr:hypothetical protein [Gemmatimonadales bacterium]
MNNPLGTADFFALEAGESLDRIEQMVSGPTAPQPEELLRMARVLRGSALMAGQVAIARAAGSLEGLARNLRDHRRPWDASIRELVAKAVEEFRLLVRRTREWNDADTERATRLGRDLDQQVGNE